MTTSAGRKLGPRPATKDRLAKKRPIRVEHQVCLDNTYAERLKDARDEMDRAEAKWKGLAGTIDAKKGDEKTKRAEEAEEARETYEDAKAAYEQAREAAAEHTDLLVFGGIGGHRLDMLNRLHRPTEEDIATAKERGMTEEEIKAMDRSPTTFPPVLIAEALIEPKLSAEEVISLIWESDNFNEAERLSILMAANRAQGSIARVDLGPTFGATPSAKNSNGSRTESGNPEASS